MAKITPIILCGGSGSRLWPLSREEYPKQFVNIKKDKTLFGDTIDRVSNSLDFNNPTIVCNENHRFYVTEELSRHNVKGSIILEPEGRNTAPALSLAAFCLNPEDIMLVLPSDHFIKDTGSFIESMKEASIAAKEGYIVTFGVTPSGPETGYGYIEKGAFLGRNCHIIEKFIEKPGILEAENMFSSGKFLWNSGIFLMKSSIFLNELKLYSSDIYNSCYNALKEKKEDGNFIRPGKKEFLSSPSDSIDYAIMEHTKNAVVTSLQSEWSDLGSWDSLYKESEKDKDGNTCIGDVISNDTSNCYINSNNRLVATIGLKDTLVVETKDAILVASRDRSQDVKSIVNTLRKNGRKEFRHHTLAYRPWGSYETLVMEERFQVKKIIVNPGAELSLQMHYHRAEHWIVVSGTAEVTNNGEKYLYTENQSTYIPVGITHRLKNPGLIPLVLIEIQSGSYLGEDDIIRLEDRYGRND